NIPSVMRLFIGETNFHLLAVRRFVRMITVVAYFNSKDNYVAIIGQDVNRVFHNFSSKSELMLANLMESHAYFAKKQGADNKVAHSVCVGLPWADRGKPSPYAFGMRGLAMGGQGRAVSLRH